MRAWKLYAAAVVFSCCRWFQGLAAARRKSSCLPTCVSTRVPQGGGVLDTALPALPPNVRAVRHPNECFDWGTFGWAMETGAADTSRYRYVIFMNSSVRGPFLPAYWPVSG